MFRQVHEAKPSSNATSILAEPQRQSKEGENTAEKSRNCAVLSLLDGKAKDYPIDDEHSMRLIRFHVFFGVLTIIECIVIISTNPSNLTFPVLHYS